MDSGILKVRNLFLLQHVHKYFTCFIEIMKAFIVLLTLVGCESQHRGCFDSHFYILMVVHRTIN